ncbi:MAG TPA: hypothetical protein EYH57_07210 [Sulfurovum sp.]|nr:hypothetical protein [Sulfurovum sp.]
MRVVFFSLLFSFFLLASESIVPSSFTVSLVKLCEVLEFSEAPHRKAKKIITHVSSGDCVQNLGCMREVTEKELNEMNETKRAHMAWKYPVWCKVDADGKRGWVRKQFLSDEGCKENL